MVVMTKSNDELRALATHSQDPDVLFLIVEELLTRNATLKLQLGFAKDRETKLQEQIKRQAEMLSKVL